MKNTTEDMAPFEDEWKQSFEGAEMKPSEGLWVNIDAQLANAEAGKLKKGIVWYRAVAAASVAIVLFTLGYFWFADTGQPTGNMPIVASNENNVSKDNLDKQEIALNAISRASVSKEETTIIDENLKPTNQDTEERLSSNATDVSQDEISTAQIPNDKTLTSGSSLIADNTKTAVVENNVANEGKTQIAHADEIGVPKNKTSSSASISSISKAGEMNTASSVNERITTSNQTTDTSADDQPGLLPIADSKESLASALPIEKPRGSALSSFENPTELNKRDPHGFDLIFLTPEETDVAMNRVLILDEIVSGKFDMKSAWAALSFAPGMFDPNFSSGSNKGDAQFADALGINNEDRGAFMDQQSLESRALDYVSNTHQASADISYQYGFQLAFPVSKRLFIQSGLNYSVNKTSASTDVLVEEMANSAKQPVYFTTTGHQEQLLSVPALDVISAIPLSSTYEFLRIPVKAGYLVSVSKKIGFMLSAGVTADLFLKNEVSSESLDLESVTVKSGSDAPFRSTYFNGVSSVTLFYKVADRYLISLEPTYSQAITDFNKADADFQSRPRNYGVGVGFTYQF